jgi:DNA-binding FrmR family transcriptional regulator
MAAARTATVPKARPAAQTPESELTIGGDVADEISRRLARVEGQIRAIQRMIAERRDCHAIVQQLAAARAALDRATVQFMVNSLTQCVRARADASGADDAELKRLTDTFTKLL